MPQPSTHLLHSSQLLGGERGALGGCGGGSHPLGAQGTKPGQGLEAGWGWGDGLSTTQAQSHPKDPRKEASVPGGGGAPGRQVA